MKKIPTRFHGIVMPFILTMFMTSIVSGISTLRAVGVHGSLYLWLGSWLWSWLFAYPTILIIMPLVKKITNMLVKD